MGSFTEVVVAQTRAQVKRERDAEQRAAIARSSRSFHAARDWVAEHIPEAVDDESVDSRYVGCALMVRYSGAPVTPDAVRERFEWRYGS